jgi:hypothetical protein
MSLEGVKKELQVTAARARRVAEEAAMAGSYRSFAVSQHARGSPKDEGPAL